jgi:uncharacterized lipoprotein
MKLVKKLFLGAVAVSILGEITGCSSVTHSSYAQKAGLFPDRNVIYSQGKSVPALQMPAGVPPIPNDPYYVVPDLPNNQAAPVSLLPPGSLAAQKAGQKG